MAPKTFPKGVTALQVLEGIDLKGKYAMVTGGNSGIGFETARALALHNAHVVLACRNHSAANEAKDKILAEYVQLSTESARVTFLPLDCSDLSSVESCAQTYTKNCWPLHYLILNAGVLNPIHRVTDAGFEATFQINHLAQFYLTQLLEQSLVNSAPARVIVVSSKAHKLFKGRADEIIWEILSPTHRRKLNPAMTAYSISKFCNILFAMGLNERLSDRGVTAYSVDPGVVGTNITRNYPGMDFFMKIGKKLVLSSPEKGAATSIYCSTIPDMEEYGGKYFVNCRLNTPGNYGHNQESVKKLWELSEEMICHFKQNSH